jgi:hypothetical protein
MRHPFSSFVAFASTVAGAGVAAVIVSSSAFADDMTTADTFSNANILMSAAGPNQLQFQDAPADALKRKYLICDRAATQSRLDPGAALECSVLYEKVRDGVFRGSFDDLLDWWRTARDGVIETQ